MTSWLQKESRLGLWGEGGIRIDLEGDSNLGLEGLAGGVVKRTLSEFLYSGFADGGELDNDEYCSTMSH